MTTKQLAPQYLNLAGQRFVILPEAEYRRLKVGADVSLPALPKADAHGNYPAAEALQVALARDILSRRRFVGWTQGELARRAGIRVETVNRLEKGKHAPSVATIDAIDRALRQAAKVRTKSSRRKRDSRGRA